MTELGKNREEVKIDVLSEGNRGVFGLGNEEAMVRISILDSSTDAKNDMMEIIKDTLRIFDKMGIEATGRFKEALRA